MSDQVKTYPYPFWGIVFGAGLLVLVAFVIDNNGNF
jgi:hypothetical protein